MPLQSRLGLPNLISNITYIEQLTSFCCGLVIVDEQTSRVKLVHYTTQKYFEGISDTWLAGIQELITNSCLTYVSYDAFEPDRYGSWPALDDHPLYHYAARYWGHHYKERQGSESLALKFLQNEATLPLYFSHTRTFGFSLVPFHLSNSGRWTGLHVTATLGLPRLLQKLVEVNNLSIEVDSPFAETPLYLATAYGHHSTVKLLLNMGANPAGSRSGPGPIHAAAMNGDDELVELLLKNGVDVDSKSDGGSPLLIAASAGHQTTVQLLLANGANIESRNSHTGGTPLVHAVKLGREKIVRLLLSKGANIETEDEYGHGLLHAAFFRRGNEDPMRIMEETGKIDFGSRGPMNLLSSAIRMRFEAPGSVGGWVTKRSGE